ncbi:MAG: DUF58 domain-containing protein [Spirochaetales bacterium]|nr:DUF58 domain-containing protein [Spirochaetales bacterium]
MEEISRKVRQLHFVSRKLVDTIFAGNYHSVFKGPGLEFDEVREYSPGDDTRFIDWNVTSRMGSPYTKTFREEREVVLQVLVDTSSSLFYSSGQINKRDLAGHIFAIIALAAVANNDKVGSLLFSDRVEEQIQPRKGRKHVLKQITQILAVKEGRKGSNLALACKTASQTMKRRGICLILSDFRAAGYKTELTMLARKHDVIAIRLTGPLDRELPASGLVQLEDPESGQSLKFMGNRKTRQQYSEYWEHERYLWHKTCQSAGVDVLEISTEDDPAVKLLHFFERRKKKS